MRSPTCQPTPTTCTRPCSRPARVYAPPAPNRTTGNPTRTWTATPKTEPCKPPPPSSPRYKTAPSPDTAPPHTCSEPPPTAGPAICNPLLTNLQRTSENDTDRGWRVPWFVARCLLVKCG